MTIGTQPHKRGTHVSVLLGAAAILLLVHLSRVFLPLTKETLARVMIALSLMALGGALVWLYERRQNASLQQLERVITQMAAGDMTVRMAYQNRGVIGRLGQEVNTLAQHLQLQQTIQSQTLWHQEGTAKLHKLFGIKSDLPALSSAMVAFFSQHLEAAMGAFYVLGDEGSARMLGSYAYQVRKSPGHMFVPGEGLVGQVLLEKRYLLITRVPSGHIEVQSGLGGAVPEMLLIFPFMLHDKVKAVLELGTLTGITETHLSFLTSVSESVAMAISAAQAHDHTEKTLSKLREQSQSLRTTSRALRLSNARLQEQKIDLEMAQAQLKEQKEELRVANEAMESHACLVAEQKHEVERTNRELINTQEALQIRAKELQWAIDTKSEVLAELSHNLRTPLNTLLILAKSFADNAYHNLNERQLTDAAMIYESGTDLSRMIHALLTHVKGSEGKNPSLTNTSTALTITSTTPVATSSPKIEDASKTLIMTLPSRYSATTPCTILLIEDDAKACAAMTHLLQPYPVQVTRAATGIQALALLQEQPFDCMILDLNLPDIHGLVWLEQMAQGSTFVKPPTIIYSGQELSRDEYDRLKKFTDAIVVKGEHSPARLLKEMALLLREASVVPPEQASSAKTMVAATRESYPNLHDKTVLLVDDDVRNLYAMTRELEGHHLKTLMAANGVKALESLEKFPSINCVIMDVMMPVMDGYETIRRLRKNPQWALLPVIALTAKAMEDDRRQAMAAGANDYLTKPVDMALLLDKLATLLVQVHGFGS
ncbi:MAG: response regulator [Magnetococcales bacterium]|nr:response regulator [Magnetococcales bacterium]